MVIDQNKTAWIEKEEWYMWMPTPKDADRERVEELAKEFPTQFKRVPIELAERLQVAITELGKIQNEIEEEV